ncbi:VOC family protein [SAR92 clade bacterium H455]|uniref:VOC family protein n=1 Tax=SAR92 clade bacterium H455 TaxID=2974818 RepID=A0ABY5TNV2_9GAMM|nr:VOC family protein [SAR92 clade bacterium H455]
MTVKPIPEGYNTATPYLSISGAKDAIEFYKLAFGATEIFCMDTPTGEVAHAEIKIGNSLIMLCDACDESPIPSPDTLGGSTVAMHLYVDDVDAMFEQAIDAGALDINSVEDQFYGDRMGTLKDPFGHIWFVSSHIEDLTLDEVRERAKALFST